MGTGGGPGVVGMIEPLQWPQCWLERNALQRFLTGTRFFGIEKRAYRETCRQLDGRGGSCVEACADSYVDLTLLNQVSEWIKEYFHWPNAHFIPEDPMEILTWDYEAIAVDHNLSHVRLLMDIEDNIGEVPDDETGAAAFNGTYGELMRFLTGIRKR